MPNKANDTELFSEVLSNVLESMAFIFTQELSLDELLEDPGEFLRAEIEFHGPYKGKVTLVAPVPLCEEIAVNMLGVEETEVSESMACDALKEVLNMACGRFLTERFGLEPVFNLTVPEVTEAETELWKDLSSRSGTLLLEAEDWQIIANISMEGDH